MIISRRSFRSNSHRSKDIKVNTIIQFDERHSREGNINFTYEVRKSIQVYGKCPA